MSLTATYLSDLSRVRLEGASLGASATYATVERSATGSIWETVRGGVQLLVSSELAQLDDYEFFADVTTSYRITSFDDGDVQQEQFTTSITASLDGKVWLKSIRYPLLNRPLDRVLDRGDAVERPDRGSIADIAGRSVPVATTDLRSSRRFTVYAQVPDAEAAAVMDLVLVAGGVAFIHVPPSLADCTPGGYVYIATTAQQRPTTVDRWVFALPCTVVAPPAASIVGTTLTWQTVERLYGSWTALWAASSTWRDLWDTIGSPSDPVVL